MLSFCGKLFQVNNAPTKNLVFQKIAILYHPFAICLLSLAIPFFCSFPVRSGLSPVSEMEIYLHFDFLIFERSVQFEIV